MYLGVVDGKVLKAASVVVVALVVVDVVVLIVVGGQVHTVFAAKRKQFIKRVCSKKYRRFLRNEMAVVKTGAGGRVALGVGRYLG